MATISHTTPTKRSQLRHHRYLSRKAVETEPSPKSSRKRVHGVPETRNPLTFNNHGYAQIIRLKLAHLQNTAGLQELLGTPRCFKWRRNAPLANQYHRLNPGAQNINPETCHLLTTVNLSTWSCRLHDIPIYTHFSLTPDSRVWEPFEEWQRRYGRSPRATRGGEFFVLRQWQVEEKVKVAVDKSARRRGNDAWRTIDYSYYCTHRETQRCKTT